MREDTPNEKSLGAGLHIVTAVMKDEVHQVGIGSDHAALSDVDLAYIVHTYD